MTMFGVGDDPFLDGEGCPCFERGAILIDEFFSDCEITRWNTRCPFTFHFGCIDGPVPGRKCNDTITPINACNHCADFFAAMLAVTGRFSGDTPSKPPMSVLDAFLLGRWFFSPLCICHVVFGPPVKALRRVSTKLLK